MWNCEKCGKEVSEGSYLCERCSEEKKSKPWHYVSIVLAALCSIFPFLDWIEIPIMAGLYSFLGMSQEATRFSLFGYILSGSQYQDGTVLFVTAILALIAVVGIIFNLVFIAKMAKRNLKCYKYGTIGAVIMLVMSALFILIVGLIALVLKVIKLTYVPYFLFLCSIANIVIIKRVKKRS